jgi:hypothetical protein
MEEPEHSQENDTTIILNKLYKLQYEIRNTSLFTASVRLTRLSIKDRIDLYSHIAAVRSFLREVKTKGIAED